MMIDLGKVIKSIQLCLSNTVNDCRACDYKHTDNCDVPCDPFPSSLLADALALLKAQTPRLLAEDDFRRDDADRGGAIPCWKEPKSPTRREGWAVIVYGKWYQDRQSGVVRYWTGRPSEKQKREAEWL